MILQTNQMKQYDGFIYLWFDRKRRMFYLGSHKGNTEDGYIGSGTRFLNHYRSRPEDFKRRILEYVQGSVLDIWEREQIWLNKIKPEEINIRYYNQKLNSKGGAGPRSEETKEKIRKSITGKTKWDAEQRKYISERQKGKPKSNGPACSLAKKGKKTGPFSEERKKNISKSKYKPISCDGIVFQSGSAAAEYFSIAASTVSSRIRNKNYSNWFFLCQTV